MDFISPSLYYPLYINLLLVLTLLYIYQHQRQSCASVLNGEKKYARVILFCALLIVFLGLRPISGRYFGDTVNYAQVYERIQDGIVFVESSSDWLFMRLMELCAPVMDVSGFFLIVEIGYIGCMLLACKRLIPNNLWVAVLFSFAAFSFYSYGINGIRNGLACSIVLLAFSYILGSKKEKLFAAVLCFAAYNIHHSTALPILMLFISAFVVSDLRWTLSFWILSIFLSVVAGGWFDNFFASLGFDDRLSGYILNHDNDDQFSGTGFRWDFLLYSMMPIVLGWYIVIRKKVFDRHYLMMLNTYILSNAFWILVIRASFSNRFAYLSWFIYPMILAYPLLKLPVWKEQNRWLNWILLANIGFTYFMWIVKY